MRKESFEWDVSEKLGVVFSRSGLPTVGAPSASSVSATGRMESESIEGLEALKAIPDFLPAPEELAFQEDTLKVTITLSR